MRLDTPRLAPLAPDEIDSELQLGDTPLNIFRTLAHHPKLLKRWLVFGNHLLAKSTLPPREREIAILRVGWLCRAGYEWGQHVKIGLSAGLSEDEIDRITRGPEAEGWSDSERALLRATDELHHDSFVSDETWTALAKHFETQQLLDLIFTVGQYHMVSMALNTLGVQLEAGAVGLPEQ
jgi:4-carboxymuconolactone decarboxylase